MHELKFSLNLIPAFGQLFNQNFIIMYQYVSSGYDNCRYAQSLSKARCKASNLRLCGVVVGLVVEGIGKQTSPETHLRTTAVKRVAGPVTRIQGQLSLYLHPRLQILAQKPIFVMCFVYTSSPYRLTSQSSVRFTSNITKKEFSTSNEK